MKREKARPNFFLHCDACHHEVTFDGWMTKRHIGFECPECGADMLTESDFKVGRRVQWMIRFLTFIGLMRPDNGDRKPGEGRMRYHYHNGVLTQTDLDG